MEKMTTAKELAKKAFCDAVKLERKGFFNNYSPEERFESWWSENYYGDHKDSFYKEMSVLIELREYIPVQ